MKTLNGKESARKADNGGDGSVSAETAAGLSRYYPLIANIAASVIFGFAMLFIKTGMRVVQYDSVKFLAFRFTLGFIVMTLLLITGARRVDYRGKPVGLLLLCGALNPLVSQVLETTATTYAPTSQIAVFFCLIPILTVLMSIPVNRERPTKRQLFFMSLSVAGILVINLTRADTDGATAFGLLLTAAATVVISAQRVLIRRATGRFTAFETIYVTTGMGAAGFSLSTLSSHAASGRLGTFFDGLWNADFVVSILYMGIMSCVVAFLCLTYASGRLPIAVSSSTSIINSVVSVLVGVFILGEFFRPADVVGTAVAFLGLLGLSLSYNAYKSNRYTANGSG